MTTSPDTVNAAEAAQWQERAGSTFGYRCRHNQGGTSYATADTRYQFRLIALAQDGFPRPIGNSPRE